MKFTIDGSYNSELFADMITQCIIAFYLSTGSHDSIAFRHVSGGPSNFITDEKEDPLQDLVDQRFISQDDKGKFERYFESVREWRRGSHLGRSPFPEFAYRPVYNNNNRIITFGARGSSIKMYEGGDKMIIKGDGARGSFLDHWRFSKHMPVIYDMEERGEVSIDIDSLESQRRIHETRADAMRRLGASNIQKYLEYDDNFFKRNFKSLIDSTGITWQQVYELYDMLVDQAHKAGWLEHQDDLIKSNIENAVSPFAVSGEIGAGSSSENNICKNFDLIKRILDIGNPKKSPQFCKGDIVKDFASLCTAFNEAASRAGNAITQYNKSRDETEKNILKGKIQTACVDMVEIKEEFKQHVWMRHPRGNKTLEEMKYGLKLVEKRASQISVDLKGILQMSIDF